MSSNYKMSQPHKYERGDRVRIVSLNGELTASAGEAKIGDVGTIIEEFMHAQEHYGRWAHVKLNGREWFVNLADVECAGDGQ